MQERTVRPRAGRPNPSPPARRAQSRPSRAARLGRRSSPECIPIFLREHTQHGAAGNGMQALSRAAWPPAPIRKAGGVLYPWLAMFIRAIPVEWTSFDVNLFHSLPRVLDPLNQGRGEVNLWMEPAAASPLLLVGLGVVAGALTVAVRKYWLSHSRLRGA